MTADNPLASTARQSAVSDLKKAYILDAARAVFEREGFQAASMRQIARAAGYTTGAIYFYFESKEALYGALLDQSLDRLCAATGGAAAAADGPLAAFRAAAFAFFSFYLENPRDLDLGFYLNQGGLEPRGLGEARDRELNAKLLRALSPLTQAFAEIGLSPTVAETETARFFAYASGVLLLHHTARLRLFPVDAETLVAQYVDYVSDRLTRRVRAG